MRILYLTIFCLNLYSVGLSQEKNFKITYRHNLQFDTLKVLQDTIGMEAILIGNSLESTYSFAKTPVQSNRPSQFKEETVPEADEIMQSEGTYTYQIKGKGIRFDSIGNLVHLDKKSQTLSVREHMTSEYVVTEEKTPVINWKITNELRTIKGYACKKATTHFRGRDYEAWFTTDIPIVAAPWKFVGLPGLVLKIQGTR
jgi:GLPGLI family protein